MTQTRESSTATGTSNASRAAETERESSIGRRGGVGIWAVVGVLGVVLSVYAYGGWIASDEFEPVPVRGPDEFGWWRLVALRVFEALSATVLVLFLWFGMIRPLVRFRTLTLMGKMILGGVIGFVLDASLNAREYLFAWNQNNINTGVWTQWLPWHHDDAPRQYAESVVWGLPMYVYFCAFVAFFGLKTAQLLGQKFPGLSRPQIYLIIFVEAFFFDLIVENIIMRTTEAYTYPQTIEALTLFAGSQYQYPLNEAFLVALVGVAFTWLNVQAAESPDGRTPVERGLDRVPARWQGTVSTMAVVGYCLAVLAVVYHIPFAWIGLHGESFADLPSYMLPVGG